MVGEEAALFECDVADDNSIAQAFSEISKQRTVEQEAVTIREVGGTCAFLMSDLATGVVGDVIYVDKGVHLF